ncbi:exonuclease domain-containing protein [Arthrobacter woluwensis]|uniref:exonuclease domain-containing protein n=1 Tax=Arthrobacter woluwensis TaxID=156980 RepID=UPI001AAEBBAB|nr:exonuclease domain-containing protein [Arthrobacter woluwensis]QTF71302.1 DNA polymerase III subunit epsilon [Arthrobacter woluwensis]
MNAGFAVVDVETTGLVPGRDRVAEIGVVHVDPDGTVRDRWETLVNPQRDLGPQRIHGIRAEQVRDAPLFADVLPEIVRRLDGRVFVAHNARFDHRFLTAEFLRAGEDFPVVADDVVCTMRLARTFLPGAGRSLQDCCNAFGLLLEDAHTAGADAEATAHVLSAYLSMAPEDPRWAAALERSAAAAWSVPSRAGHPGLSRADSDRLGSLRRRLAAAWSDGMLSPESVSGLYAEAARLGVPGEHIDALLQEPAPASPGTWPALTVPVLPGQRLVLTGQMGRPRHEITERLGAAGYPVHPTVTRSVALVIAADPDSMSLKARRARDYGIPVVGEDVLHTLLGGL